MDTKLAAVIQEFVTHEIPHYEDAATAWGRCDITSYKFIDFARAHGIEGLRTYTFEAECIEGNTRGFKPHSTDQWNPAPDVYVVHGPGGSLLKNEGGFSMCTWHCVVDAGDCLIDFTSRQYQTAVNRMSFPLIIPMNKAMAAHV